MRIATWNINSIRQRLDHLLDYLREISPDILCLQEIKCLEETFPRSEIEALGYNFEIMGQKTFNGVAIISKFPLEDVRRGLPGNDSDDQARYIEAVVSTKTGVVRVASIYLPNGNPVNTEKYPYKLRWMEHLRRHAAELLELEEPLVLAGDYNAIPHARDVHDPQAWAGDALFVPATRAAFQSLLNLGLTDAFRACSSSDNAYTFWDYQAGAWQKNNGIRIDHLLLSPQAADRLQTAQIDKELRAREKPSDHVPVRIELEI